MIRCDDDDYHQELSSYILKYHHHRSSISKQNETCDPSILRHPGHKRLNLFKVSINWNIRGSEKSSSLFPEGDL